MEIAERLTGICEPLLARAGYELVMVEVAGLPRKRTVRIFIDREGGVTIDDCAHASRLLEPVIEAEGLFDGSWVIEVSSPGLERPLIKPSDYERFSGRKVKIKLKRPLDTRKNFTGVLCGLADGERVMVRIDGGEVCEIPVEFVAKANLVFEWK